MRLSIWIRRTRLKWLPKLTSGQWIGAWGLTEHNTGSDAKGAYHSPPRRWRMGAEWHQKFHYPREIRRCCSCDCPQREKGTTEAWPLCGGTRNLGFWRGQKENKLGMRASETAEMVFDNCRIPDANRLGPVGDGFIQSMKILDGGPSP